MNTIRQHFPAYFSGFEEEVVQFNNVDDLFQIEFVKNFANHEKFLRYSSTDKCLMAEYEEGYVWWVVGYLEHSIDGLPQWYPKYRD